MKVDLTEAEALVLAGEAEHSPFCRYDYANHEPVWAYRDEDGNRWADEDYTVPFVEPPCTCGYFATRESGEAKLRAALGINRESAA